MWDLPGGWVEYNEDVREAARRELLEETGLEAVVGEVYDARSNFHSVEVHVVGIWFLGTVTGGRLAAADDAMDARFFPIDALPELAFETDRLVLGRLRDERLAHGEASRG